MFHVLSQCLGSNELFLGQQCDQGSLQGLFLPQTCAWLVLIQRISNPYVPSQNLAMFNLLGWLLEIQHAVLDEMVLGVRQGERYFAASLVPCPGLNLGCCMQDDKDGVGCIAILSSP